jgi:hypothetical protein
MKKIIVISLLVLIAILGGLAVGAFAKNDEKAGQYGKLVGLGIMGNIGEIPEKEFFHSWYWFTNPDPINSIEITKIAILRADGSVVYEGPYINWTDAGREIKTSIEPHEIVICILPLYMYLGGDPIQPDSWMTLIEAIQQPVQYYTVEIHWQSPSKSSQYQLIGWQQHAFSFVDPATDMPDHIFGDTRPESQMVNITLSK